MKTKARFKKGDTVKIVNPNNHFYDEVAEILLYDEFSNKYDIQFQNGYKCKVYHYDLVRHLSLKEQRALLKAQLIQMADLALSTNDKEWFDDIAQRLKQFKE